MSKTVREWADHLARAEEQRQGVQALTESEPDLSIERAYDVQLESIQRKVNQGKRVVGKKIGLTSIAMQELLGVSEPDYGHLLDSMVVENGDKITPDRVLQPRVEGEIAFVLRDTLKGPKVTTLDVLQATAYVLPALEVVDSRVADWNIKLPDTIADNASSGLYVLGGQPVSVDQVDLAQIGMVLEKNGDIMNTGVGAAASGNPAHCVAWLANKLAEFDIALEAGEVVLSGALSAAVHAHPGDHFRARLAHLGEATVGFA